MSRHLPISRPATFAERRHHYVVERELSDRLRFATREERRSLYPAVYDEFHREIKYLNYVNTENPEFTADNEPSRNFKLVEKLLASNMTFLEIGAGGCIFSREMSRYAERVIATDVSVEAMRRAGAMPPNVERVVVDGISFPFEPASVDVVFSNNLVEHLHPDDAEEQMRNVFDLLRPGGSYVCVTPNRINGPHDVSVSFDDPVATGFHLKEYSYSDLASLFQRVGFEHLRGCLDIKGRVVLILPVPVFKIFERGIELLPKRARKASMRILTVRAMLMVRVIGRKPVQSTAAVA